MGRLIDADDLHRKLFEYGCHKSKMHPMDVMKMIEEQPTAYDVEKVVEELEKASWKSYSDIARRNLVHLDSTIEIVRKGGVNE